MNDIDYFIYTDVLFSKTRETLVQFKSRPHKLLPKSYWKELSVTKKKAVDSSNQLVAKAAWCFETIGQIQDYFINAYIHLMDNEFYKAWCLLEECEIHISLLDGHFHERNEEFGMEHIRKYVIRLQNLFPYGVFGSPGFTAKHKCSICGELITPRHHCGHEIGNIYNGELCTKIVTDIQFLEFSIVTNPVQKYSVINVPGNEYNFELLKYLSKRLSSPWELWDYHISKKTVPKYSKVGRNELCPCESGLKYKKCCLRARKEIDHYTFTL